MCGVGASQKLQGGPGAASKGKGVKGWIGPSGSQSCARMESTKLACTRQVGTCGGAHAAESRLLRSIHASNRVASLACTAAQRCGSETTGVRRRDGGLSAGVPTFVDAHRFRF